MKNLEEKMMQIPGDDESMNLLIGSVIRQHVAEVYSPPRVTAMAHKYWMNPGFALDLTVEDEEGNAWDFDVLAQRQKCKQLVIEKKPWLLIGSPMCTIFSAIQAWNKKKMGAKRWRAAYAYGESHLLFALELYVIQIQSGRYILHKHPLSASNW